MFSNNKNDEILEQLKKLNGKIERISNDNTEQNNKIIDNCLELKTILNNLSENYQKLNDENSLVTTKLNSEIETISQLSESLQKRINSFKLIEDNIKKKFCEDTKIVISEKLDFLNSIGTHYKALMENTNSIKKEIQEIIPQIKDFKEISRNIQKSDFELSKYANYIAKEDKEKLRLMQENERLKQIIAKERRSNTNNNNRRY
jgi:methyl-accepting chemotaxis protein